jgi:hypothetical protein
MSDACTGWRSQVIVDRALHRRSGVSFGPWTVSVYGYVGLAIGLSQIIISRVVGSQRAYQLDIE